MSTIRSDEETGSRAVDESGLQARAITVVAGGQTILRDASLTVTVGELIGLIGASGSGKSTLLRALAGVTQPTAGSVMLDGHPVRLRSTDVGYVPFGTLLHGKLTLREALDYAAQLRLPPGTSSAVRDARVDEVLEELDLGDRADTMVESLSDGQRRRAACGAELVGHPPVLLLDEPATGLDAVLEARMMRMLRRLADDGRGVLVATHATSSIGLCDRVAVVAPGGELRFVGPPAEMLERFGVSSYDEVYEALDLEAQHTPHAADEVFPEALPGPGTSPPRQELPPLLGQVAVLASRYARCTLRDRRSLGLLIGQAPVIGLAIGLALPADVLGVPSIGVYYRVMLCFMLVTGSIWLGLTASCREIVKERPIVERETSVGVRFDAYMLSKCAVLFPLVVAQVVLLVITALMVQPLGASSTAVLQLLLACIVCAWAAAAMGLWLSAAVKTPDQASSAVPLIVIPQLLLAGAVIPYAAMIAPMKLVANVMIARWALTGMGSAIGLDQTLSSDVAAVTGLDVGFYETPVFVCLGVLVSATLLMLSAAGLTLDRSLRR